MRRLSHRVDKLERDAPKHTHFVHVFPGETDARAIAAYRRKNGRLPKDAAVIVIRHSFKSRI